MCQPNTESLFEGMCLTLRGNSPIPAGLPAEPTDRDDASCVGTTGHLAVHIIVTWADVSEGVA